MAPAPRRPQDRASSGRATAAQRQASELKDDDRLLSHSSSAGGRQARQGGCFSAFLFREHTGWQRSKKRRQRAPQPRRPSQRARTQHSPDQFGGLTSRPHYYLRASILGRPPSRNSRRNSFPRRRRRRRSSAALPTLSQRLEAPTNHAAASASEPMRVRENRRHKLTRRATKGSKNPARNQKSRSREEKRKKKKNTVGRKR